MTERRRCQGCTMFLPTRELTDGLCNGCHQQAETLGLSDWAFKDWAKQAHDVGRLVEYRALRRGLIGGER